jgi:hypothetical protein
VRAWQVFVTDERLYLAESLDYSKVILILFNLLSKPQNVLGIIGIDIFGPATFLVTNAGTGHCMRLCVGLKRVRNE